MTATDWEVIRNARETAARSLKPLRRYRVVPDSRRVLLSNLRDGDLVLDVGANDRNVERYLKEHSAPARYFSCDVDRTLHHDYYSLDEVDRTFDVVCLFDVIEHLQVPIARDMVKKLFGVLGPGGKLYVSTPNVDHPTRFWRDCTHITPFRYDELAGLMIGAGFTDIQVFRIARMKWQDRLRYVLAAPTLRLLGIDFAPSILLIGKRPG
jgi:SAM-dependent methyltransferase